MADLLIIISLWLLWGRWAMPSFYATALLISVNEHVQEKGEKMPLRLIFLFL